MKRTRRQHGVFAAADDGNDGAGAGGAAPASGAAAGAAASGGAEGGAAAAAGSAASSSLLSPGTPPATGTDWLPEKYQVKKDDGTVDVEASAKKVTEAHKALETRMGSTGLPPPTPDEYTPEGLPAEFNFDEVKADPMYQDFAKLAHAAGINNAQMGLVLNEWNKRAGELAGEAVGMTLEEAKADLETTWGTDYAKNLPEASGAVMVIAQKAGITLDQINDAGLGRNPVFLRLMHSISGEFKADGATPNGQTPSAQDFDTRLAEIKAHPGFADARHPEHGKLMQQKQALYDARYPAKKT